MALKAAVGVLYQSVRLSVWRTISTDSVDVKGLTFILAILSYFPSGFSFWSESIDECLA